MKLVPTLGHDDAAAAIDAGSCRKEDFIDPEFARAADAN